MALSRAELARLSAAVAHSPVERLERIVAMLDALPERGEADRVLDAARVRLRALRLLRPLNFTRVLFMPLDGAIVAPGNWRPGEGRLPRTALTPLATMVEASLGERADSIVASLLHVPRGDATTFVAQAQEIWNEGARVLAAAKAAPAGWRDAGLRSEDFRSIAQLCAAVLAFGGEIQRAVTEGEGGPPETLARAALKGPAEAGSQPLSAALATLLRTAKRPGALSAIAASLSPGTVPVVDAALEQALSAQMVDVRGTSPDVLPERIEAFCALLDDAAAATSGRGPELRRKLEAWRHGLSVDCRAAYTASGQENVLAPAGRLARGSTSDEEVAALENSALLLRRLELAARKLGNEGAYDAARRSMLQQLRSLAGEADLATRIEMARLAEILGGAEAGVEFLGH